MMTNAADWAEICQLKSAYGWHYDTPDFEALVDLFTDDAVCVFVCSDVNERVVRRPDVLREAGADLVLARPGAVGPTFANPMIAIDGDEATGKWYLLDFVVTGGADEPVLRVMGVYDERYRREDGGWKIARMDLTFLWNSDVGRIRPGEERRLDWHADEVSG